MTRKTLEKHFSVIKRFLRNCTEVEKGLIFLVYERPTIVKLGDELLTDYIFCIAKLIDETGAKKIQEILSWYIFDNNFGKNKKRLYINGEYQIIDNSRKLLNILKKETI